MGSHLHIDCDCGAHLVDQVATQFEDGFLHDDFGVRAKLGIAELPVSSPSEPDGEGSPLAPAIFVAWQEHAAAALAASAGELPTLYQVWLRTRLGGRTGRAVYFEAGGEHYAVFASLSPTLTARKLPDGWLREKLLPAQKQSTGHAQTVIPRVEDRSPGVAPGSGDADGNIPISPQGFEDLFLGSDVELEALPFTYVFERELRELAGAAAHARRCGRPLHVRHV